MTSFLLLSWSNRQHDECHVERALTCCAAHTSRSAGLQSSGTRDTFRTARRTRWAPVSPVEIRQQLSEPAHQHTRTRTRTSHVQSVAIRLDLIYRWYARHNRGEFIEKSNWSMKRELSLTSRWAESKLFITGQTRQRGVQRKLIGSSGK